MEKIFVPIRLSHILGYSTVGAIIRGPDFLMTPTDIRQWTDKNKKPAGQPIDYVEQVKNALDIQQELRQPPIAIRLDNGQIAGSYIPAMLFPCWMRCPGCGMLYCKPWKNTPQGPWYCTVCDKKSPLAQVPWVLVHEEGHMADVPWHRLVHKKARIQNQKLCRPDWESPYLRLTELKGAKFKLVCTRCQAHFDFHTGIRADYKNLRPQPWIFVQDPVPLENMDHEKEPGTILMVNDTRIHRPIAKSALVIPPESRISKRTVVHRLYANSKVRREIDNTRTPLQKKSLFSRLTHEFNCTVHDIGNAIKEIKKGYPLYGQHFTQGLVRENEYHALVAPIPDQSDEEDFVTCHYSRDLTSLVLEKNSLPWQVKNVLDQVISVTRLKEILILTGFQRLYGTIVPPDIVGESDWLPALELYGDGIFFTFNQAKLEQWESLEQVQARVQPLVDRFENNPQECDDHSDIVVCPRFILLHTIAHILIKRLEAMAGYPAASIKERIYAKTGENAMAGILIYVAVPDVEGSLGGLCELAEPRRFLSLLCQVFEHARWCSLDPVCSEHEGQGPHLLNRSACHACALIPEPACAYGNILLDRALIKGNENQALPQFLTFAGSFGEK